MIEKIEKINKSIFNEIKTHYIYYSFILIILIMNFITLDYEIYSPGKLENLNERINVKSDYDSSGSFNLTYVTARDGTIFNILLSYIIPSWDIVSVDDMRLSNESLSEIVERNKVYMHKSSYDAIIAAFDEANISYDVESEDYVVVFVYDEAETDLKTGDYIKEINGIKINSKEDINNIIDNLKSGDKVNIKVSNSEKEIDRYAIIHNENDMNLIGISYNVLKNVKTDPEVVYTFKENESGSSGGLMSTLEIYNKITPYDLTQGRIISGTGTINETGVVGEIAGVKYKLKGAVKNGANVFIVPSANYEEALELKNKYNYDIELIKADTLSNVINELRN